MKSGFLLDYNIKPKDILELLTPEETDIVIAEKNLKTRGNSIENILEGYKDSKNLYLENYENIGYRNYNLLKENGLDIKEAAIGLKFEELTKTLFEGLGFNVDKDLLKKLNNTKDKADILINLGNNEIIIVECKTVKESNYNKFSSVSRQLKAYSASVEWL